jgi:tetratricopeptide (TPR) repeat protein
LKLSGDKSLNNYANWEAYKFYSEAINALKQMPESEENKRKQIDIRLSIADSLVRLSFPEELVDNYEEGEKLSKELGDTQSLSQFYNLKAVYYQMTGELELGLKYAEETLKEAEKIKDIELVAISSMSLLNAYNFIGQHFKIAEIAPGVIDLLEKNDRTKEKYNSPVNLYSFTCAYYGQSLGWLGDFDEAQIISEKGIRNAEKSDDIYNLGFCEMIYCSCLFALGDSKLIIEYSEKSIQHFEEVNFSFGLAFSRLYLGYGYYLNEDQETAKKHADQGLKIQINSGLEAGSSMFYGVLSIIHCDSNDLAEAQIHAEKAVELSKKNNERAYEGLSRVWLGKILGKKDSSYLDKGEDSILQGIKMLEELKLRPWVSQGYFFLGELYTDSGQKEKALENLTKAETEFKDMGMDYWLNKTREVLAIN